MSGLGAGCLGVEAKGDGVGEPVSSATSGLTSFDPGTLIIPVDTAYQQDGGVRAYGLVYQLLRGGVPVQWAIEPTKAVRGIDIPITGSATIKNLEDNQAIPPPINYHGGPFIIDHADSAAAMPIINQWFASHDVTAVHVLAGGTIQANIARKLVAAPRIAVLDDGNQDIAFGVFRKAGILDSQDNDWPADSPDLLTQDAIAAGTSDRGLFDTDGTPKYCHLTSMHYVDTDATTTAKVVAEVRRWLTARPENHAYMQCQAVATFENDPTSGRFLTTGGIATGNPVGTAPNPLTNKAPDDPLTQADGTLEGVDGAIAAIVPLTNSALRPGGKTLVTGASNAIWLLSGPLQGDTANGKVTYLGGHDYLDSKLGGPKPISIKVLLDSLFESGCASMAVAQPVVTLDKTGPVYTTGDQITYTITYANTGMVVANNVTITDHLPAGTTFASASSGGSNAAGTVTWALGTLAPGAMGSVTVTVGVTVDGDYTNQAVIHFTGGGTNRTVMSRFAKTVRETKDLDQDGVPDSFDNCPALANSDQMDQNRDGTGDACFLGVSGGGCQTGGGGLGIGGVGVLAALALLRRRRRAAVAAAALVACATLPRLAAAQVMEPANFGVERFRLASDRDGMFDVESGEVRGDMAISAALWAGLANDPLVDYQGQPGNRIGSLVANRAGGSLGASISLRRWLQLGFDLPLVVFQDRPTSNVIAPMGLESLHSFGTGDLRVIAKFGLLHQADHGVSLAVLPVVILPTRSTSDAYFDDGGLGFAPELALSKRWTGWRAGLDAGYHARRRAVFLNQVVDDELFARAGVGYQFADRGGPPLGIDVTMSGATAARRPFDSFNENHLEALVGATYDLPGGAQVFGGAGAGLRKGFGTPDWRGLLGVRVGFGGTSAPSHPRELDRDGDGIPDSVDKCPDQPEDKDGFEDSDGCPDPDNDKDGVLDADDRCINVPGPAALRGCPDRDRDGDGIPDSVDKCPDQPEDKDGFEDGDGCPDPDNDKDGTPDVVDACPLEAGPAENKGCPDADRDGDGVVDRLDRCPDEKGLPDKAGCPNVSVGDGRLDILDRVHFKTDRAEIEPQSFALLDNVVAVLKAHDQLKIQVEGHTDSQGDDAYNKTLSQRRAEAVVAYLVNKGIAKSRLVAKGFGEEKPIADNHTDEGRAQNRRVVFTILSGGDNVKVREQGAGGDIK